MLCSALAFGRLFTLDERYAEAPFETLWGAPARVRLGANQHTSLGESA